MEYIIYIRDGISDLAEVVALRISEGWLPLGGVSGFYNPEYQIERWSQALIRYPAPNKAINANLTTPAVNDDTAPAK